MQKYSLLTLLVVTIFFSLESGAQVIIGDCNFVYKNVTVTGGEVGMGSIEGCPQSPEKTLRIGYFWLDSASLSFLFSGHTYGAIRDLVGDRPIIVQNDVFTAAKDLLTKFGTSIDKSSFYAETFSVSVGDRSSPSGSDQSFEGMGSSLLSSIKVYDGNDSIYFPDLTANAVVNESDGWPSNYSLYVVSDDAAAETLTAYSGVSPVVADELYNQIVLWRNVERSELENYSTLLQRTREEVERSGGGLYIPSDVESYVALTEAELEQLTRTESAESAESFSLQHSRLQIEKLPSVAKNKSLRAMLYVTREGWPADFLQSLGFFEGHGDVGSWSTLAPPRKMFVLVALIENMGGAGATYRLKGFNVLHSSETKLRAVSEVMSKAFVPFPMEAIGKDDKVILPLKIEFRANAEIGRQDAPEDLSASPSSVEKIEHALSLLSSETILQTSDGSIHKEKSSFSMVRVPQITKSYIYGPVATLDSLVIDEADFPVRQYAANGLFMVSGFEGGSCPTLYVKRRGESDLVKIGKILHTANGASQSAVQEIPIGKDVEAVFIEESEPERTIVKRLDVFAMSNGERVRASQAIVAPFAIEWGERARLNVKFDASSEYLLRIEGHYDRYEDLARQHSLNELPLRRK